MTQTKRYDNNQIVNEVYNNQHKHNIILTADVRIEELQSVLKKIKTISSQKQAKIVNLSIYLFFSKNIKNKKTSNKLFLNAGNTLTNLDQTYDDLERLYSLFLTDKKYKTLSSATNRVIGYLRELRNNTSSFNVIDTIKEEFEKDSFSIIINVSPLKITHKTDFEKFIDPQINSFIGDVDLTKFEYIKRKKLLDHDKYKRKKEQDEEQLEREREQGMYEEGLIEQGARSPYIPPDSPNSSSNRKATKNDDNVAEKGVKTITGGEKEYKE